MAVFLIILGSRMVGFRDGYSYYEEMVQTQQLSQEDFYQQKMVTEESVVLIDFPPQLEKLCHARVGDVVFTNGVDTLYLTHRCVIDGYLSYRMENNHSIKWDLFPQGEKFLLCKLQEE